MNTDAKSSLEQSEKHCDIKKIPKQQVRSLVFHSEHQPESVSRRKYEKDGNNIQITLEKVRIEIPI